jgi:hypothetical protein
VSNGSCRCDACGLRFRSLSAFDMHREGDYSGTSRRKHTRRCLSVEEMAAKGMRRNDHGAWTTGREFTKAAA